MSRTDFIRSGMPAFESVVCRTCSFFRPGSEATVGWCVHSLNRALRERGNKRYPVVASTGRCKYHSYYNQ